MTFLYSRLLNRRWKNNLLFVKGKAEQNFFGAEREGTHLPPARKEASGATDRVTSLFQQEYLLTDREDGRVSIRFRHEQQ